MAAHMNIATANMILALDFDATDLSHIVNEVATFMISVENIVKTGVSGVIQIDLPAKEQE
jgi:hypothetical protein